jgi:hypothetical protein
MTEKDKSTIPPLGAVEVRKPGEPVRVRIPSNAPQGGQLHKLIAPCGGLRRNDPYRS